MKMKNIYAVLWGIILVSGNIAFVQTKDDVTILREDIWRLSDTVFPRGNVLDSATWGGSPDPNLYTPWDKLSYVLREFVDKNSEKNKKLLDAFLIGKSVGDQLFETLNIAYTRVFSQTSPSSNSIGNIRNWMKELKRRKPDLEGAINSLESTKYFFTGKKNVKIVLLQLMQMLREGIDRLLKDFEEQMKKRGF